jgi:hypothetical protein
LICVQKLDTSLGQRLMDSLDRTHSRIDNALFQPGKSIKRNDSLVSKLLLAPAKKRPSGPNLSSGDHKITFDKVENFATLRV